MSFPLEFVHWVEQERAKLQSQLARLEAGTTHLGERPEGSEWIDITQEEIARLKGAIANLESVLAIVREG